MTADSQWAMQQAVYDALRDDTVLQTLTGEVPARIYDDVPDELWASPEPGGDFLPYVVIGLATAREFDTKTEDGCDQTLMIHTWSRYQGLMETKQIMAAIVDALDQQSLSVTGHDLVQLRFELSETFLEEDGVTRHGLQRFRAYTEASS
jgi:Protein of unknown function (DUF3168)